MSRSMLGLKNLLIDAVERTTNLVERSHAKGARRIFNALALVPPLERPARFAEALQQLHSTTVFGSIKLINRGVGEIIEGGHNIAEGLSRALDDSPQDDRAQNASDALAATSETPTGGEATPMRSDALGSAPWMRDSATALLNGGFGDHLAEQNNALETRMSLRHNGEILPADKDALKQALPDASGRVCLFIHGLACTEWSWCYGAEQAHGDAKVNYGTLLQDELGITPIYVRYNTGLHISHNGRRLAALIQRFVDAYPVPLEQLLLVGHSMGGLVARSACYYASKGDASRWVNKLSHVICLGSPHLGAPLEKASHLLSVALRYFDTMGTQIPGHLLNARSAGIKDLRFGYVVDEDWQGADEDAIHDVHRSDIPFVEHARYFFVAATITTDSQHPLGQLLGDVLVREPSAKGQHPKPLRSIPFAQSDGAVTPGLSHLQLTNHPTVYAHLKSWCAVSSEDSR